MSETRENGGNAEKLSIFRSVFRGREDCHGEGAGVCVKETVTDDLIHAHLTGKRRLGQYPLAPGILDGAGVYWAVMDIDMDDLNAAIEVVAELAELGLTAYIERSKSRGFHVWVFFSDAIEARAARAILSYANGSGHEVFPKQTSIKNGSEYRFGNYINLPLYGADVKQGKTVFLNAADQSYEPYSDQWGFLSNVQKIPAELVRELLDAGELEFGPEVTAEPEPEDQDQVADYADMLPCVSKMMAGVSEGCRDVVCFTLAKHWRVEKKLPESATLAILLDWNEKNSPPMAVKDVETKVKSAYRGKGGGGYTSYGCENDLLAAFCVKDQCPVFGEHKKTLETQGKEAQSPYFRKNTFIPSRLGNELMSEYSFIFAGGQLYVYQNGVYKPIGEEFIRSRCRERLGEEARVNRLTEVVAHIEDLSHVDPESMNRHKNLINLKNGMLDWQAGELLDHSVEYRSTIRIPVEYNVNAGCDNVLAFFMSTLPPDCIEVAEELFGYVLIPDVRFHKAFMLTGSGNNGKSTFLSLLEAFIGSDNCSKIPLQELCDHRFKRADLYGKMLNVFADLDARALHSSTYFKTVVSGDPIDAERKNRDPFYFRPFSRLVFSANEIPQSPDRSYAFYRRWCIIPFPNRFSGSNEDKTILRKLTKAEQLSGLLNHALAGLRRLFHQGDFTESETVKEALEEYQKANDTVAAFIGDRCELKPGAEIERARLYDAYTRYCESEGYKTENRRSMYQRIRSQPGIGEKKLPQERFFVGIDLK